VVSDVINDNQLYSNQFSFGQTGRQFDGYSREINYHR
jgi:hypothetical protein